MRKVYWLFLIFISWRVNAQAQDCQSKFQETYKLYETGRFEEAIANLDTCLKGGFDKPQQARAWKLIAYCYLSLGDTPNAQTAVQKFMLLTPRYNPALKSDPTQFQQLVHRFRPKPMVAIGFSYSKVFSRAFLQQAYSLTGNNKKYTIGNDKAIGIHLIYSGHRRFMFSANATYLNQSFGFSQSVQGFDITHKERSTSVHAGLWAGYQFRQSHGYFQSGTYVFGGLHYQGLLYDQADLSRKYTATGVIATDKSTDILNRRNVNMVGWDAGLGYNASIFFAEIHLSGNFSNMVVTKNRYSDYRSMYDYYFIDDNFWLGSVQVKLGILKTIRYQAP